MFGERVGRPRRDLIRAFHSATVPCNLPGVDWVSFQPGPHQNSDQMVAEGPWDILGQRWLFLAVCDGMFVLLIRLALGITAQHAHRLWWTRHGPLRGRRTSSTAASGACTDDTETLWRPPGPQELRGSVPSHCRHAANADSRPRLLLDGSCPAGLSQTKIPRKQGIRHGAYSRTRGHGRICACCTRQHARDGHHCDRGPFHVGGGGRQLHSR